MTPNRFHTSRYRVGLASLFLAASLAGCSTSGQGAQPTVTPIPQQRSIERPTYTVERGDIVEQLRLSGRVAAVRQEDLGFTKAGTVLRVHVRAGDKVRKGQLLAELEQREELDALAKAQVALEQAQIVLRRGEESQRFAIARAKLDLQEAQAILAQAKTEQERELARIGVQRAQLGLEEAEGVTNEEAEKQVAAARIEFNRLKQQVETGKLRATFAGQVGDVAAQPGTNVEPFAPVVSVLEPGDREVRVENVTGSELNRLSVNQPVTITFSRFENQPIEGRIEALPQGNASTQSQVQADTAVHISYEAPDLDLELGDLATAVVTLQNRENVLFLPPAALRNFQGRQFVVVQDGDRQRRVDIQVGITGPDRVEIVEGLQEDQVVVGQ